MCGVVCFCEAHCRGCVKWWQPANCVASVESWEFPFAWQAQHSVQIRRVWNVILRGRRSIWDTPHSTLFTLFNIFTLFAIFTLHLTLHTLRFTVDTWGHGRAAQDFDLVRYTEPEAAFVCRSVLAALSHLHALRILHRDIKPGNILAGNGGERILLGAGCIGCDCSNRSHHWWESSQMVNSFIILSLQKNKQF